MLQPGLLRLSAIAGRSAQPRARTEDRGCRRPTVVAIKRAAEAGRRILVEQVVGTHGDGPMPSMNCDGVQVTCVSAYVVADRFRPLTLSTTMLKYSPMPDAAQSHATSRHQRRLHFG